jgi:hypothetical protein
MPDPYSPKLSLRRSNVRRLRRGISPQGDFSCLDRVDDPFSCLWLSDPNNLAETAIETVLNYERWRFKAHCDGRGYGVN